MPLFVVTLNARKAGEDDRFRGSDKFEAESVNDARECAMQTWWDPHLEEDGWRPVVSVEWAHAPSLRHLPVKRAQGVLFVPLPRELWRDAEGCCCRYCSPAARESRESYWDTLAIAVDERNDNRTWMVHAPEYHGVKPKRAA